MLSCNSLGANGRLGNQMFQYAAIKGIAIHRGFDFCIPFSSEINEWYDHFLTKYFVLDENIKYGTPHQQYRVDLNPYFHFNYELFENCPDNTDLHGYFQTEKYFSHIEDEIRKDFTFKNSFNLPADKYVTLHIRRGDYVSRQDWHPVLSLDYYRTALEIFEDKYPVVVLSDDINWCKENINADVYMDGTSQIQDLYTMAHATHNVIANSTFSWWAAWLNSNKKKKVISPSSRKWFGPVLHHYNMEDLIPSSWIQLDV